MNAKNKFQIGDTVKVLHYRYIPFILKHRVGKVEGYEAGKYLIYFENKVYYNNRRVHRRWLSSGWLTLEKRRDGLTAALHFAEKAKEK